MARVISVSNQKGGVGKTTTSLSLSAALALAGRRVLLVDMDPQGNATSGLGQKKPLGRDAYRFLSEGQAVSSVVTIRPGLDLVPTNRTLAAVEGRFWERKDRYLVLRKALEGVRSNYDYIFIDCPPSLGIFPMNALCASDAAILPIQCEYFAMEGLSQILETIKDVRRRFNRDLAVEGILLTMFHEEHQLCREVAEEVRSHFSAEVYTAVVPRDMTFSEAASKGVSVFECDIFSRGARAYLEVAREVLGHAG